MSANQRKVVRYQGRVQGVGFRYTTENIARAHPVAGYVTNLPDGAVRVVVEGETAPVERFLAEVERAMRRNIESVSVDRQPATGEFRDFRVKY